MFSKIRNNTFVNSGLEVYQIAREVYTLVNTSQPSETTAENLYLAASLNVTAQDQKTIVQRPDYKTVHYTAKTYRSIKKSVDKQRAKIAVCAQAAREKTRKIYQKGEEEARRAFYTARGVLKDWLDQLAEFARSTKNYIAGQYKKLRKTLNEYKDVEQYKRLLSKLKRYSTTKYNSIKTSLQSAIKQFNTLVSLNERCIRETASFTQDSIHNFVKTNITLAFYTLADNAQIFSKYLSGLEWEIYYKPGTCVKPLSFIKEFVEDVTLDVREQESIIFDNEDPPQITSSDDEKNKSFDLLHAVGQDHQDRSMPNIIESTIVTTEELENSSGEEEAKGEPVVAEEKQNVELPVESEETKAKKKKNKKKKKSN